MRREDAPREGWYPDPGGGTRLRWWDGEDWSDQFRSIGSAEGLDRWLGGDLAGAATNAGASGARAVDAASGASGASRSQGGLAATATSLGAAVERSSASRRDQEQMVADMRRIARAEAERMATQVGERARDATRSLEATVKSAVDEYGPKVLRWVRRGVLVFALGWIVVSVLQTAAGAAQVTLFEWLGERVDEWFGAALVAADVGLHALLGMVSTADVGLHALLGMVATAL